MIISVTLNKEKNHLKKFNTHSPLTKARNHKSVKGRVSLDEETLEEFSVRSA